jgi:large subunit ribosomal protein L9
VALHPEVEVSVTVNIARTQEEADVQAGKAAPPSEPIEINTADEIESLLEGL